MSDDAYITPDSQLASAVARFNPGAVITRHGGNAWIVRWNQPLQYPPGIKPNTDKEPIPIEDSPKRQDLEMLQLKTRADALAKERDEHTVRIEELKGEITRLTRQLESSQREALGLDQKLGKFTQSKEYISFYDRIVAEEKAMGEATRLSRCRIAARLEKPEDERNNVNSDNWV